MYALIAILDENTEKIIKNIWQEMSDQNLSHYAYEVYNREPHITLASFETTNLKAVIEKLRIILSKYSYQPVTFNHLSTFLGSRMLTLNPVKTVELSRFHQTIHQALSLDVEFLPLYIPQNWVPHLTLANRISEDKIALTYKYCLERCMILSSHIISVKIIKINQTGQVTTLYDYQLKERSFYL